MPGKEKGLRDSWGGPPGYLNDKLSFLAQQRNLRNPDSLGTYGN